MSNDPLSSTASAGTGELDTMDALKSDPVLQGHSALTDPDLSGSTAASWTGTGGPDPGGMVAPADFAGQTTEGMTTTDSSDLAGQAQQVAGQVMDQAQQAVGQVMDQAQEVAGQVVDTAKTQTTNRLSQGKDQIATTVEAVAQAVRQGGQTLRDQDQAPVAGYAEQAAGRLEGVASYLRDRDVPQLVADVEDFARRRPSLFLGAAFGLGILAARFIKSSRQQAQGGASGGYGGGSAGSYMGSMSNSSPQGAALAYQRMPSDGSAQRPTSGDWTGGSEWTQSSGGALSADQATDLLSMGGGASYTEDTVVSRVAFRAEAPLPSGQDSTLDETTGGTADA